MLGLEKASNETQGQVIGELGLLILQLSIVKATEKMTNEQLIAFEELLAKQKPEEIQAFLQDNIFEFDMIAIEASKEVIEEYKSGRNEINGYGEVRV